MVYRSERSAHSINKNEAETKCSDYMQITNNVNEFQTTNLFHFNKFQDEIQVEIEANANAKQSLDELSKEVNEMKAELTKTSTNDEPANDPVSDGDNNGKSQRAVLGEIDTVKKIIEILESVVVPTIVDRANAQKQYSEKSSDPSAASSDPIKILPKGFKLLQHHAITTSNVDDGSPATTNQKPESTIQ